MLQTSKMGKNRYAKFSIEDTPDNRTLLDNEKCLIKQKMENSILKGKQQLLNI